MKRRIYGTRNDKERILQKSVIGNNGSAGRTDTVVRMVGCEETGLCTCKRRMVHVDYPSVTAGRGGP